MTSKNITTFIKELHSRLQPWLQGDLQRRSPGEFASTDGTFRLATRTIGDAKCIVFLLSERKEVCAYWALEEESWKHMYAGLHRLRLRLEVLGTLTHLKYWYDDRCCDGCEKEEVTETFLKALFPSMERRPYKDGFHAINGATRLLHDGSPEGKSEFSKDIAEAIRPFHKPDVAAVAEWVMERPLRQGMKPVKTEAEAEAIAKKDYKEHIRREGPAGNIIDKNLEGVVEKWTDRQKVAKSADPPQRCCIRSKTDELEGTLEHVNLNMRSCARKGCYSHPLPIDAMCAPLPRSHTPHSHISQPHPATAASGTSPAASSRSRATSTGATRARRAATSAFTAT
jgi:hypothetical protein